MYKKLAFPLNVYAKLLELDKQPVEYLHFGLFESDNTEIWQAQKKSTEKVLSSLPDTPASILEVGIGLGTTQKILLKLGFNAQGITPDKYQIEIAKERLDGKGNLNCEYFEKFNTEEKFDVILFQESAQYIKINDLFDKVCSLLKSDGRLIILDEMCLNPSISSGLHHPEDLIQTAQKLGFELILQEDLSIYAKPTMKYIQEKLRTYSAEILMLLDNNKKQLSQLEKATEDYIEKYKNDIYGYGFLVFDKK